MSAEQRSARFGQIGTKLSEEGAKVTQWMLENKLKLNADKTHLLTVGTQERLRNLPCQPKVYMDGIQVEEGKEKCELLLGCTIESSLKWHIQVQNLLLKLKTRLAGLNKIKFIVPFHIRKILTHSIFNSVLVYCLPLFGGCEKYEIKALQVLQKQAARIVTHSPPRSSRIELFTKLDWLTDNQLIVYHTLISVFKLRQNQEPEYLAEKLLQNTGYGRILIPNIKLSLAQKSFMIRGKSDWNELPATLRSQTKIGIFKKHVKKWIFDNTPRFLD